MHYSARLFLAFMLCIYAGLNSTQQRWPTVTQFCPMQINQNKRTHEKLTCILYRQPFVLVIACMICLYLYYIFPCICLCSIVSPSANVNTHACIVCDSRDPPIAVLTSAAQSTQHTF